MAGAGGRKGKKLVGRYEVGRTIGHGTFAKVKLAVDADTGATFAMKVLDKDAVVRHQMLHQANNNIFIYLAKGGKQTLADPWPYGLTMVTLPSHR
ncbi:hypothetical protein EJB05_41492, partial [Eragrostis curvula]